MKNVIFSVLLTIVIVMICIMTIRYMAGNTNDWNTYDFIDYITKNFFTDDLLKQFQASLDNLLNQTHEAIDYIFSNTTDVDNLASLGYNISLYLFGFLVAILSAVTFVIHVIVALVAFFIVGLYDLLNVLSFIVYIVYGDIA